MRVYGKKMDKNERKPLTKADKMKRLLLLVLAIGMLLPFLVGLSSLWAVSQSDIDTINKKLDELKGKKSDTEKKLESIKSDISSVLEQKELLDNKINICNDEIELISQSIEILEQRIADNNTKLAELNSEKEAKYELFKKRLRVLYEEGKTSYLEVILKSDTIEDLLNRTQLVGDILKQDKQMIRDIELLCEEIQNTQTQLQNDKQQADEKYASLQATKADLEADYNASVELMSQLEDEEQANKELLAAYEKAWAEAAAKEESLTRQLAEQKKAEESSRLAAMTTAATEPPAGSGSTTTPPSSPSGSYIWPTPGYTPITSDYGYRYHPVTGVYSFHSGIDIGAPYGTAIRCIANGTVIENTYSSVYGNMIKVDHGGGIVSLYGHMNARSKCAIGSSVKQGDVLGYVGSTGMSTGPHLHLTIYCNGSIANPLNYVKR